MRPKSATRTRTATGPTIDPYTIGVVGATPMGRVVTRFFAENGFHVNWVDGEPPAEPIAVAAMVRYRSTLFPARVTAAT